MLWGLSIKSLAVSKSLKIAFKTCFLLKLCKEKSTIHIIVSYTHDLGYVSDSSYQNVLIMYWYFLSFFHHRSKSSVFAFLHVLFYLSWTCFEMDSSFQLLCNFSWRLLFLPFSLLYSLSSSHMKANSAFKKNVLTTCKNSQLELEKYRIFVPGSWISWVILMKPMSKG